MHFAEISITKSRVNKKRKIVVITTITGLAVPGSGWRLEWKPKGKKRKKPEGQVLSSRTTRAGRR